MPWKTTKLRFCGFAVRRRSLHALTLFFAIAAVPALSWALLALNSNLPMPQRMSFVVGAGVMVLMAFQGWWCIFRNNSVLFRNEAWFIWPGAAVLLSLATWLGCRVAQEHIKPGPNSSTPALALGGAFMVFVLVRCILIGRHPKRTDIVRGGGPTRRHSRSSTMPGQPADVTPAGEAVVGIDEEDGLDVDAAPGDSPPTDSAK